MQISCSPMLPGRRNRRDRLEITSARDRSVDILHFGPAAFLFLFLLQNSAATECSSQCFFSRPTYSKVSLKTKVLLASFGNSPTGTSRRTFKPPARMSTLDWRGDAISPDCARERGSARSRAAIRYRELPNGSHLLQTRQFLASFGNFTLLKLVKTRP